MQLDNVNNVSFGRIGFVNKSVKEAFYSAFDKPRFSKYISLFHKVGYI